MGGFCPGAAFGLAREGGELALDRWGETIQGTLLQLVGDDADQQMLRRYAAIAEKGRGLIVGRRHGICQADVAPAYGRSTTSAETSAVTSSGAAVAWGGGAARAAMACIGPGKRG